MKTKTKTAKRVAPTEGYHALVSVKAILKKVLIKRRAEMAQHIVDELTEMMPTLRTDAAEIDAANRPLAVARNGRGKPVKKAAAELAAAKVAPPAPEKKTAAKAKNKPTTTASKAEKAAEPPKKSAKVKAPAPAKKANGKPAHASRA